MKRYLFFILFLLNNIIALDKSKDCIFITKRHEDDHSVVYIQTCPNCDNQIVAEFIKSSKKFCVLLKSPNKPNVKLPDSFFMHIDDLYLMDAYDKSLKKKIKS